MEHIIIDGLKNLGLEPSPDKAAAMAAYGRLLLDTNATTNLTAITEPESVVRLHFLDSAALLCVTDLAGKTVADVGSGAGFPGVPLRIMEPSIRLTVMDSVGKKMDFVRSACEALGMEDVTCLWGRVEEMSQLRESFDVAVSRAVAELDILAELCLPLVKPGGVFIAMKGPDCDGEVSQAEFAVRALGGRVREIRRYDIPGTDVTHSMVLVEKVKATPPQYPRRYAQIKKKPLRG